MKNQHLPEAEKYNADMARFRDKAACVELAPEPRAMQGVAAVATCSLAERNAAAAEAMARDCWNCLTPVSYAEQPKSCPHCGCRRPCDEPENNKMSNERESAQ